MSEAKRCPDCKFYAINLSQQSTGSGECRKGPPQITGVGIPQQGGLVVQVISKFPDVQSHDYCHEFERSITITN
jgi:hypothetical protein